MDTSQEHTRWNCRYHIGWAPKFRRKIIYGKYKKEFGVILRRLCQYKGIEIVEANACIDHIHMCIKIPPNYSVAYGRRDTISLMVRIVTNPEAIMVVYGFVEP